MLIWKGAGILGVVVPFGILLLFQYVIDFFLGVNYYSEHEFCFIAALVISAIAVYFIGKKLNEDAFRDVVDIKTGMITQINNEHTLFFIPLQYVSVPILLFVLLVVFK